MQPGDRLVGAQVASLAALAWPGRPLWHLPPWVRLAAAAIATGGGASAALAAAAHGSHLTPRVTPPERAALLQHGAYRWSRHPVYGGLLLAAGAVAVLRARPEPLAAAGVLAAVLHVKTGLEEVALRERFGAAYVVYASRTPRLLGLPRRSPRL